MAPSSSDEVLDKYLHFLDDEALQAHRDRFANREVLTGRRVLFNELGDIESLFRIQMLVSFLASTGDTKYYPHLVSQFYANFSSLEYTCESFLLGIEIPFDEILIGQLLKIPSFSLDITLTCEDLGWSYQDINKSK